MKTKLTNRLILTRKPPASGRLIISDTAVPGLSLRINPGSTQNPKGLRYWLLRYQGTLIESAPVFRECAGHSDHDKGNSHGQ